MKKPNPSKGFDGKAHKERMERESPCDSKPKKKLPKQPYLPRGYRTPKFAQNENWDKPSRSLSPTARDLGNPNWVGNVTNSNFTPWVESPGNIEDISRNATRIRGDKNLLKCLASHISKEHLDKADGRPCLCVVTGTYNRLDSLARAVESVRNASAGVYYQIVAIDGGSTDGTKEWIRKQKDIYLIEQEGELTGAVKAFNLGFAYAVEQGFPYVMHFNDDAEIVTQDALLSGIKILQEHPFVGEVAFAFDLRGGYGFDLIHGKPYGNFGIIRREAGMMVALAQGDSKGKMWWNEIYRTYGADTEFGCWLWKLGWTVFAAEHLQVHDTNVKDQLREINESGIPQRKDSRLFWQRWPLEHTIEP